MEKNLPLKIKKILEKNTDKLDKSGYVQFNNRIELNDTFINDYINQFNVKWIDGLQLLHESVKVWFSSKDTADIIYENLHLFENDDLLVLIEKELNKQFSIIKIDKELYNAAIKVIENDFDGYCTISDFGIIAHGAQIDHLFVVDNKIKFYCGEDPTNETLNGYSEEIILTEKETNDVLEQFFNFI